MGTAARKMRTAAKPTAEMPAAAEVRPTAAEMRRSSVSAAAPEMTPTAAVSAAAGSCQDRGCGEEGSQDSNRETQSSIHGCFSVARTTARAQTFTILGPLPDTTRQIPLGGPKLCKGMRTCDRRIRPNPVSRYAILH
jgi:hypothetical protein